MGARSPTKEPFGVAKTSRPRLRDIEPRPRLFRRLDELRQASLVPWIAGPAGSGKTSLLVSYVEQRRLPALWYKVDEGDRQPADLFLYLRTALEAFKASRRARVALPAFSAAVELGAFARRFFEALFAELPPETLLVFDDYHLAPEDSAWQLAIAQAIECIPAKRNVVVLSRKPPPAALARPHVHGDIVRLETTELLLTLNETRAIAERRLSKVITSFSNDDAARIHEQTGGWAAGVSLLLRGSQLGDANALGARFDTQTVFDYLASAVFSELGADAQRVLLHAACFRTFSPKRVATISGIEGAGQELGALYRSGLLMESDDAHEEVFRLHLLLRSFLLYKARQVFGDEELLRLRRRAASLLSAEGQDDDAFELLREIDAHADLAVIVLNRAQGLVAQGRTSQLERWIASLPEALIERDGWLSYWKATCAMTTAPGASRVAFEHALECFVRERDGAGAYLAWAGALHALTYDCRTWRSVEAWLERLGEIEAFCPTFPSAELGSQVVSALLMGLTLSGAEASTLERWAARALALAENATDRTVRVMTTSVLVLHHALHGDSGRAATLVASLGREHAGSPAGFLARVAAKGAATALASHRAEFEAGIAAAAEGVTLMGDRPVPMWSSVLLVFGSWCAIERADQQQLARFLEALADAAETGTPLEVSAYHSVRAHVALVRGSLDEARVAFQLAVDHARAVGFPYGEATCSLNLASIAYALGEPAQAKEALAIAQRIEDAQRDPVLGYWRLLIEAEHALGEGQWARVVGLLRQAFAVGRERQLYSRHGPGSSRIADLCRIALSEQIEVDYVRTLIRRRQLRGNPPPYEVPEWPWPVRVRTLGSLDIASEDRSSFSFGRSRVPPLLLKAIVALAPAGQPVAVAKVVSTLWPDSDGDDGMHAFEVTLGRLRKAFGTWGHRAIRVEAGLLALDSSLCWTDVAALEALLAEIGAKGSPQNPAKLGERLLALYSGPFGGEDLPPALLGVQTRLRAKVANALQTLGCSLREQGDGDREAALYTAALEADERLTLIFPPLVRCLVASDRRDQARALVDAWRQRDDATELPELALAERLLRD